MYKASRLPACLKLKRGFFAGTRRDLGPGKESMKDEIYTTKLVAAAWTAFALALALFVCLAF